MAILPSQIELWCQVPSEHQRLEFKEARSGFDFEKLCAYCVAIANEGGGHLVLGLTDKPPRTVVGSSAFPDPLTTMEKVFHKVAFRVDLESVEHPNGRVVVASIPARPKGTAYSLDGKYLMRNGRELVAMSEDVLRAIFAEGKPDWLEEASATGLSASDVVSLIDTQSYFDLMGQPYPTDQVGVISGLVQQRLLDQSSGGLSIRRLCALLFAKRLSAFPDVSRKAPRVVVYDGSSKLRTRVDQTGQLGYASGFRQLVAFVMNQLPQNEVIHDAIRTPVKLAPEDAVRELVANALIHQDFSLPGMSPMIEVYSDRVEFSNPGTPAVPVERFVDGYQSRNERLADLMRRMGICEEKSSGIDRVVTAAEAYQLPAPDFVTAFNRVVVTLFGPKPFEEMTRDERVRACYQHAALKRVMRSYLTNATLRERFRLPETKNAIVSQIIAHTVEARLIKPDPSVGASMKLARYLPVWA